MLKKRISIILVFFILFAIFPQFIPVVKAETFPQIKVGDYIQLGKYYNEPILWRCVDFDQNGPLMLADKILTFKSFDTKGSHKYLDGTVQADNIDNYRTTGGSNLWETSSLRSWLNSMATASNVVWLDGCTPTIDNGYYNSNAIESGFLAEGNFTQNERDIMKSVSQKSLLSGLDVHKLSIGGTSIHAYDGYSNNIESVVNNYNTAYYDNIIDKVFVLDVKQLNKVYQNSGVLGESYYIGTPTQKALDNLKGTPAFYDVYNWTRTPNANADAPYGVRCLKNNGSVSYYSAYATAGIRPAFYLNQSSLIIKSGNGSMATPYMVSKALDQEENKDVELFQYKPDEFNKTLALRAAKFSMLAYDDYEWVNNDIYKSRARSVNKTPLALLDTLEKQKFIVSDRGWYNYGEEPDNPDNVSFVIAKKNIIYNGESRKLIAIIIRGTDSIEWQGNMDVTGLEYHESQINHWSWDSAKRDVHAKLLMYLTENKIINPVFLVTGHSRGGAVANLLADSLSESTSDVFAYTFATPNATTSANKNRSNIFNFCFDDDFVTQMPLSAWEYDKHGRTFTAVANNLYEQKGFEDFRNDMDYYVQLSNGRDKANFNKNATKGLINYAKGTWPSIESYYNKNKYVELVMGADPHLETIKDITLHDFFKNYVALAAMKENTEPLVKKWLLSAGRTFGPVTNFFVEGSGQAVFPNYINDTHQMFTYYSCLKYNGFKIININKSSINLYAGQKEQLSLTPNMNVSWSVISGTDVVEIANGLVVAKSPGIAAVRATYKSDNSFYADCKVTVNPQPPVISSSKLLNLMNINAATNIETYYDSSEIEKLKSFVLQDENLQKLGWKLDDFSSWYGVMWNNDAVRKITSIDLSYKALSGVLSISDFTNLQNIDVSGNLLTGIDLTGCTSLVKVDVSHNQLNQLSIENSQTVNTLNCAWNNITELNVDGAITLDELDCNNNRLTSIHLGTNLQLTHLYCADNDLNNLDISSNSILRSLSINGNSLDIQSGSTMLNTIKIVSARENSWVNYEPQKIPVNAIFNVSDVSKLISFANQANNLIELKWDLSKPQEWNGVEWIKVRDEYRVNRITLDKLNLTGSFDLSNMAYLKYLSCNDNQLMAVNVSNCKSLVYISCYNSALKWLAIANCSAIRTLNCEENYLDISDSSVLMNDINDIMRKNKISIEYFNQKISDNKDMFDQTEYNMLVDFASVSQNQSILSWNIDKPGEWTGVVWGLNEGKYRVKEISFEYKELMGKLDISNFEKLTKLNCRMTKISAISLPNSIKEIGSSMFYECNELTDISIPNGITSIGENAFKNCIKLTSVKIPESTLVINNDAFRGCKSLTEIKIPSNVYAIGDGAFYDSESLQRAIFMGNAPCLFGLNVFNGTKLDFKVYYNQGATGFNSIFHGYPSAPIQDVNEDGKIDILDIATVSKIYNEKKGGQGWTERYDIDFNGIINIYDLVLISKFLQ